jgi:hypothetical protein
MSLGTAAARIVIDSGYSWPASEMVFAVCEHAPQQAVFHGIVGQGVLSSRGRG